ncbi:MAG: hypothetical protein J5496_03625 [Lachnospiraceae bacterium]|nr:hypothetical protein [Lachnospiraceae bacterium]
MSAFFANPFAKGQYEYFAARKRQQLRITLVFVFFVAAFVAAGLIVFGNTKNLLTIPGVLLVLPMANFFVTYLALVKGKELGEEKRAQVRVFEDNGLALYHLMYVDEKGKRHFLDHTVVYQNAIVAYASTVKAEERVPLESDCIVRLKKKNINLRLKVYTEWEAYLARLAEIEPEVPEDQVKLVEKAQEVLLGMCL